MVNFRVGFICKMSLYELGKRHSLQLGKEVAIVESIEFVIEAFFDIVFGLIRRDFARIVLHIQFKYENELVKLTFKSINFYQNMPDTIYDDLKEQGLLLSQPEVLQLPPIRPPKPTLVRQLGSFIAPEFKLGDGPHKIIILPILNSAVLVARANTLICYKFDIEKETGRPLFYQPKIQNLQFCIKKLHICDSKFLNDRGEVPFIVQAEDRLVLFYVDLKEYKLVQKNTISYKDLFSIRFICQKEVLLLTRELEIYHYMIHGGKLKPKGKNINANLPPIPKDQYIHHCEIVGSIDQEQDSIITFFYLIKKIKVPNSKNEELEKNFQILKVKEYLRTFQGKLQPQEQDYTVISNTHSSVLPDQFDIWFFDSYFCIETKHQILILKKKFKKYLFIDNIMENLHGCNLKINPGAIISSYNTSAMELSVIQFGDPKCVSKMLDTIDLDPAVAPGFRLVWPFKNQKETCLMLAFEKQKTIIMHNVIKMQPMKKMLDIVKGIDKSKISMVQQIAVNLGIQKKDFYLTLWQASKRQIPDIHTFLLPCCDVPSIKKEIRLTMRRKKIIVPEFIKILEKIALIIKNQLKTNLTQQILKEYIKNDFLLRKVKLKQKEKSMDHRDLQKVYQSSIVDMFVEIVKNDLYPEQRSVDPLHVMIDVPEKEQMDLRHVFQQFRIVILQNYKKFVVDFLSHFKENQIQKVIKQYNYLLPLYPFQIKLIMHENEYKTEEELKQQMILNHNGQNQWFAHMTSVQFARELSKERIERELHQYYPTSKITDAINTLVNSPYGASQKLRKHGLISCSIEQYKEKLKDIYNNKLYLKVCEYANQKQSYKDQVLSPALVQTFKQKNKLEGQAYDIVKLYASMHKFMLKYDFCQKKNKDHQGFTTEELIQFDNQDLIALFFLENRQRKEFIFNQFRDLYINLYKNPQKFNQAISQFIHSENCSRIQLQIFIKEVAAKGIEFQKDNQGLIGLLIQGFCMKLEIREDTDTKHFIELMQEIELNIAQGIKLNKIIEIRRCLGILNVFNCEKLTYYEMLKYQQDNKIFKILLQKYFNQELKKEYVRIQDQQIALQYCRNMLTVLLYLLQTVYCDVQSKSLLLTYGQILIQWKQFDVLKGIIYDQQVLQKLRIDKISFVEQLVRSALLPIYTEDDIVFNDETKGQIQDILDILPQDTNSPLKRQELAKLSLIKLIEGWEVTVHLVDIHYICMDWAYKDPEKKIDLRKQFVLNLFDVYIDKVTINDFRDIYTCLQYTLQSTSEAQFSEQVQLNNPQFVNYMLIFALKLLEKERYAQIIQIFAFVKQIKDQKIEYDLMSQAILRQICALYPQNPEVQDEEIKQGEPKRLNPHRFSGKQIIEYFIQNFRDDRILKDMFMKGLKDISFGQFQKQNLIKVEREYCFKKKKDNKHEQVFISLDLLWKIACDQITEREQTKKLSKSRGEELYYAYYFLLAIFRQPENGLGSLDKISYSLQSLTNLMFRLESTIDDHSQLWAINTYQMFKYFLRGLVYIGIVRIKQNENIAKDMPTKNSNIEAIKNFLKADKVKNKQLYDCISRVQAYINATKMTKKKQKQIRYEKKSKVLEQSKPKQVESSEPEPKSKVQGNATMTLRVIRQRKYQYTQMSNMSTDNIMMNDNELLGFLYKKVQEERQEQLRKKKRQTGPNTLFLTGLTGHKKEACQKEIIQRKEKRESGKTIFNLYTKDDVTSALRDFYEERTKSFKEVLQYLQWLQLGQPRKMLKSKLCKVRSEIPEEDLVEIFSFDFFFTGLDYSQVQFSREAYNQIKENIQNLLPKKDPEYVRIVANFVGVFFEANAYLQQVYIDTMINIVSKGNFSPDMTVRFRTAMELVAPQVLKQNISNILYTARTRQDMRVYVKKELEIWARQKYSSQKELVQQIRGY